MEGVEGWNPGWSPALEHAPPRPPPLSTTPPPSNTILQLVVVKTARKKSLCRASTARWAANARPVAPATTSTSDSAVRPNNGASAKLAGEGATPGTVKHRTASSTPGPAGGKAGGGSGAGDGAGGWAASAATPMLTDASLKDDDGPDEAASASAAASHGPVAVSSRGPSGLGGGCGG